MSARVPLYWIAKLPVIWQFRVTKLILWVHMAPKRAVGFLIRREVVAGWSAPFDVKGEESRRSFHGTYHEIVRDIGRTMGAES